MRKNACLLRLEKEREEGREGEHSALVRIKQTAASASASKLGSAERPDRDRQFLRRGMCNHARLPGHFTIQSESGIVVRGSTVVGAARW